MPTIPRIFQKNRHFSTGRAVARARRATRAQRAKRAVLVRTLSRERSERAPCEASERSERAAVGLPHRFSGKSMLHHPPIIMGGNFQPKQNENSRTTFGKLRSRENGLEGLFQGSVPPAVKSAAEIKKKISWRSPYNLCEFLDKVPIS